MTWLDKTLGAVGLQRKAAAAPARPSNRPKDHHEYFVDEDRAAGEWHWLARAYIYDTEPDIVRGHQHYSPTVLEQTGTAKTRGSARSEAAAWGRKQTGAS